MHSLANVFEAYVYDEEYRHKFDMIWNNINFIEFHPFYFLYE